ncbi:glutathione S-transferase family protein [Acanthopleuribacter pedis]|uniref:Glutathione S-transferase family protein n=1 Tax=Acanthopleuribacter pedis TaxID=442870 RepID=A0A8J7U6F3_9BACT|nr:glutathione S-transferase family protein [Acanthopleuribacter pedis]MBO1320301.1 glutathione S-transferase family protein [Acanthopleuribacter pedis]
MTIKLHGVPASNFYNIAKVALQLKGLAFEEIPLHPNEKTPAFLAMSPLGKIPCIQTDQGAMSESLAIALYAERLQPEPALFPADAFAAGRALQIHQLLNLYGFQHTAKLIKPCFFGAPAEADFIDATLAEAGKVITATAQVCAFAPYIAGEQMTIADLTALFELDLLHRCAQLAKRGSPLDTFTGWAGWRETMLKNPIIADAVAARDQMWEHLLSQAASA